MLKQLVMGMYGSFPPGQWSMDRTIAEGDWVAQQTTFRGTHKGTWRGAEPTGAELEIGTVILVRVANGKLAEMWAQSDSLGLQRQIGAIKSTTAPTPTGR